MFLHMVNKGEAVHGTLHPFHGADELRGIGAVHIVKERLGITSHLPRHGL